MMEEDGIKLAASIIFILVAIVRIVPRYLSIRLRPSTFAQAAKLRRTVAAKEKELAQYREKQTKERKSLYYPYMKYMTPLKALTYLLLAAWFWKSPVAAISMELVQPFGKVLSWKSGASSMNKVTVGIVPWLIVCTRVSKLIGRRYPC